MGVVGLIASHCCGATRCNLLQSDARKARCRFAKHLGKHRSGVPILEVPIHYQPRSRAEGKKIGWRDAWQTGWTLIKWRLLPFRLASARKENPHQLEPPPHASCVGLRQAKT